MSQTTTSVLRRINGQLVAPRASRGELWVVYAAAVAGSALAVVLAVDSGMSMLSSAVAAVVAFDLFGGSVANATAAAKRRFHGAGHGWRRHLGFVVAYVQPFVIALMVPASDGLRPRPSTDWWSRGPSPAPPPYPGGCRHPISHGAAMKDLPTPA